MKSSFNHKTGAEDVHFTSVSSHSDSESDAHFNKNDVYVGAGDNELSTQKSSSDGEVSDITLFGKNPCSSDSDCSSISGAQNPVLEMIMVKDVEVRAEVRLCYFPRSCFVNEFLPSGFQCSSVDLQFKVH